MVYAGVELGHDSEKLIKYFEEHGSEKCPPEVNPAEWMLDVIERWQPRSTRARIGVMFGCSPSSSARNRRRSRRSSRREKSAVSTLKNVRDDREYAIAALDPSHRRCKVILHPRTGGRQNYIMGKLILHIFTGPV